MRPRELFIGTWECNVNPTCNNAGGLSTWSMVDKLMFEALNRDQQAIYAATMGCARVPLEKVRSVGIPCTECEPRVTL